MCNIRKATQKDIESVEKIYNELHAAEESGKVSIGWVRGIYPTRQTAQAAVERGDLFVLESASEIAGAAIINQIQVEDYYGAPWTVAAKDSEVCVLHALVISPRFAGLGYGKKFVHFYENYAKECSCHALRLDTNEKNHRARAMYHSLGYQEIAIVPSVFNGIPDVGLVLLEKRA